MTTSDPRAADWAVWGTISELVPSNLVDFLCLPLSSSVSEDSEVVYGTIFEKTKKIA